jgi:hypothetical protein
MARHKFTREERSKGGKVRCAQESMKEARERGFEVTMDRHPFFARKHLKAKIKQQNKERSNVQNSGNTQ